MGNFVLLLAAWALCLDDAKETSDITVIGDATGNRGRFFRREEVSSSRRRKRPRHAAAEIQQQVAEMLESGELSARRPSTAKFPPEAGPVDTQKGLDNAMDVSRFCTTCASFEPTGAVFVEFENVAAAKKGGVPFGSGSQIGMCERPGPGEGTEFGGSGSSCFNNINDGVHGEKSTWQPGLMTYNSNKFAGVRFNGAKWLAGFSVSIPSHHVTGRSTVLKAAVGQRAEFKFVVQVTTAQRPNHVSAHSIWKTMGSFDTSSPGVLYFRFNATKPVMATALRIVVDSPVASVDELQVYGTRSLMPVDSNAFVGFANVAFKEEGGSPFASGSREGYCSTTTASDGDKSCGTGSACYCHVNDGKFADEGAWMPNRYRSNVTAIGDKKFVGIRFDEPKWIAGFRISSQGNSSSLCCTKNYKGIFDVQVSIARDVSYDTARDVWSTVGSFELSSPAFHWYKFGWPVNLQIAAVRLVAKSVELAVDEWEIYGGNPLTRVVGEPPKDMFPRDMARADLGAIAFGSSSIGCSMTDAGEGLHLGRHCFSRVNDGLHGNESSWIPDATKLAKVDAQHFVGIRFPELVLITGFSLSSPGVPRYNVSRQTCFSGQHAMQVTTDGDAAVGNTTDSAWDTIAKFARNHEGVQKLLEEYGDEDRSKIFTAHYFKFVAPVLAKGIRVLVESSSVCIDELEVYGEPYDPPAEFDVE